MMQNLRKSFSALLFFNSRNLFRVAIFALIIAATTVWAAGGNGGHGIGPTILWITFILLIAKFAGLIERFGQPAVLGELVAGVIIGNLTLLGIGLFEPIKTDNILIFLAELGVIVLLFQIGLESNISKMRKVGAKAFWVAIIGVVAPFVLGTYIVGPWLLPGLSSTAYLFLGAALTATSVGITARVFKDLNALSTPSAQIVLGAAVIDDVLGLIILAVVSAIATIGAVSLGMIGAITAKSILFLVGAIVIGHFSAPYFGRIFAKINTGTGMKLTLAISFCLLLAYAAGEIGLAPIVGAFAAGLVLDPVHFKYFKDPKIVDDIKECAKNCDEQTKDRFMQTIAPHAHRHIEDLIEPIGYLLVPIFFIMTGASVNLETLFDPQTLLLALGISVVAILGKIIAGLAAGKGQRLLVGVGMVPRGEVGLIFAAIGSSLGVVDEKLFSIIVVMVIVTTLATPPFLAHLIKKQATVA